ncbi:peptide chain release factor N(5)-glutamine methyltransferase [Mobilitalea sibirica]|uniref:Release factor glutamine methyltransferase n=1 Tax=Mobilitalea sibirica TaxID=1462919 RepID=A0A8J7H250_9FIRM|nr:peptide chain release factor N(5)-glutamine methyltransferase [Mobilitalea sibirica]MBH1940470.1 peptide chain release factor N(5)-glutamine methyltransferase [Mobilitalea sibirica]
MGTYYEELQRARKFLRIHNIADADVDAWYLLAHVLGINRADFFMLRETLFPEDKLQILDNLLKKRVMHIPLQHIIGCQEFMGFTFEVNEHVLIPRQDTECLVEEVLKICHNKSVLDLCTGSGCIIISLTKLGSLKSATGSDISDKALITAKRNANRLNTEVEFLHSDLFDNIEGVYDIIVSNPPYIPTKEIKELMPEVRDFEPITALDGSSDGLLFYRNIIASLNRYLKKGGYIFFEIGHNQGMDVSNLLLKEGFIEVSVKKDLSGLDRIVSGKRP